MDLRNDQPLQFPKTQALMIAVPGTLGGKYRTMELRLVRSTFLLRGHDSSAPGLRVLRPLPSPVCRAWRWGCLEPHVGEPHVGGGGRTAEPGALRVCSTLGGSREADVGRSQASTGWDGESDPAHSFFPRTFLIRMDLTVKKASGRQR